MKLKNKENGIVENVKILICSECNMHYVMIDGVPMNSTEILAEGWDIVDIARDEILLFNKFLEDTRFMIRECWDYFEGKIDAYTLSDGNEDGPPHEHGESNGD